MATSFDHRCLLNIFKPLRSGKKNVIVTGMQKSGTTAIAKLLGFATDEVVCSDPFYRLFRRNGFDPRPDLYSGDITLKQLWKKQQHFFPGTIIKDPDFVFLLPQIRAMFPKAKIVFIIRDPRDTIRSILNRLALPGNPAEKALNLDDIPVAWRDYIVGKSPSITGKNYIEILAKRWLMTTAVYFENEGHCLQIKYEEFYADKSEAIRKLAGKLGYESLHDIGHLVDVQYQPRGNPGVDWGDFFGHESLGAIEEITRPMLERLGYGTSRNISCS